MNPGLPPPQVSASGGRLHALPTLQGGVLYASPSLGTITLNPAAAAAHGLHEGMLTNMPSWLDTPLPLARNDLLATTLKGQMGGHVTAKATKGQRQSYPPPGQQTKPRRKKRVRSGFTV